MATPQHQAAAATFGLQSGIYAAWAQRNRLGPELHALALASQAIGYPATIESVLRLITSSGALATLHAWREDSSAAWLLHRLADAVDQDQAWFDSQQRMQRSTRSERDLRGHLDQAPVLAMLLQSPLSVAEADLHWIDTLKLWLLCQQLDRTLRGIKRDQHLVAAATGLRLALKDDPERLRLILDIRSPANTLVQWEHDLRRQAGYQRERMAAGQARQLARALERIAGHEQSADEMYAGGIEYLALTGLPHAPFRPEAYSLEADAAEMDAVINLPAADEEEATAGLAVDPQLPPVLQDQQARWLLLHSTEQLNYLPWSWDKPNPRECERLLSWCARPEPGAGGVLQALVYIAAHLGRSLFSAARIVCDAASGSLAPGSEWVLDWPSRLLHRAPPRRPSGYQPGEAAGAWLQPQAERNQFRIPDPILSPLEAAYRQTPAARRLGQLWRQAESLEQAFRDAMRALGLPRVTPGMLAQLLPQAVYAHSRDMAYTRLLCAHPRAGLPAACAYASYPQSRVAADLQAALTGTALQAVPAGVDPIALGSRLAPLDAMLQAEIQRATERLEARRASGDALGYHNAYSVYFATALLAGTGIRPVADPAEDSRHFNLGEGWLYADDKHTGGTRSGRLLPVPQALCALIKQAYLPHLQCLAAWLLPGAPRLAQEISLLAQGRHSGRIPFLFLLECSGQVVRWQRLTPGGAEAQALFAWPLPPNLFRHRLADALRERGHDTEVIEAILGHAETGCETYGDYSDRIWLEDMSALRPGLEHAFTALGFAAVRGMDAMRCPAPAGVQESPVAPLRFGRQARAAERKTWLQQALRKARLDLLGYLREQQLPGQGAEHAGAARQDGGRDASLRAGLQQLSSEQFAELQLRMLCDASGTRTRRDGFIRYRYLHAQARRLWHIAGRRLPVSWRYARAEPAASVHTERAPCAIAVHRAAHAIVGGIMEQANRQRLAAADCAYLAAVALCVEGRVADPVLLRDVALLQRCRLVSFQGRHYLEYWPRPQEAGPDTAAAEEPEPDTGDPLLRLRICQRTAALLDRALEARRDGAGLARPVPAALAPLLRLPQAQGYEPVADQRATLLTELAVWVDQANAIELPGLVGAYLAGRIQSLSLPHTDWLRIRHGRYLTRDGAVTAPDMAIELAPVAQDLADTGALQSQARMFFRELRRTLGVTRDRLPQRPSPNQRRDIAAQLRRLLAQYQGQVSAAVWLLGDWAVHLLTRAPRYKPLAPSSVARYVAALSPLFEAAAATVQLPGAGEEQVTAWYGLLLETCAVRNRRYVALRLREFQRYAHTQGVADPDWGEINWPGAMLTARPGQVSLDDYRRALAGLTQVQPQSGLLQDAALLLLLARRFGLRRSEALGLNREDWVDWNDGGIVVLVRGHRERTLKHPGSRRQVPLLGVLAPLEQEVVRLAWLRYAARSSAADAPVFVGTGAERARIASLASQALRAATGNPEISLHHARHGLANDLFAGLYVPAPDTARTDEAAAHTETARQCLLGSTAPTRRKAWALSRHLGHVVRATAWNNYVHGLDAWRDALVGLRPPGRHIRLSQCVALEDLPHSTTPPSVTMAVDRAQVPIPAVLPEQVMALLRLLARAVPAAHACAALALPVELGEALQIAVTEISARTKPPGRPQSKPEAAAQRRRRSECTDGLLARITEGGWTRLLALARAPAPREAEGRAGMSGAQCLAEAALRIGRTRQLLCWRPQHFAQLRSFVDQYEIANCRLLTTTPPFPLRLQQAQAQGFVDVTTGLQIDAAHDPREGNAIKHRMALCVNESRSAAVRNSLELAALWLSHSSSCCWRTPGSAA